MTPAEFAALAFALVAADLSPQKATLSAGILDDAWAAYQQIAAQPATGNRAFQIQPSEHLSNTLAALGQVGVFITVA